MSKGLKIGLGIGLVLLLIVILYFIFRTPTSSVTWKAIVGGDISGTQYDIERGNFTTLDDAKARAVELNAASFLVNGNSVFYKNAKSPVSTTAGQTYTLYVKQ